MNPLNDPSSLASPSGFRGNKIPKGYSYGQINQYTPQQQQTFSQQFGQVAPDSFTSRLAAGDQSAYNEYEQPAMQQFAELQGNLGSRFSQMGSNGARRSSGFQNTMNQAGSNFAQSLASNRLNLRNQAIRDLMSMSNQLLYQRPYEQFLGEKRKKGGGIGGILGTGLGAVGGFFAGGPAGSMAGAQIGNSIGSSF